MSFRVGFLRGAFVVLATIALSGCNGDDEDVNIKFGTPTWAEGTATVEVTVENGKEDAEVTASMMCGDSTDAVGTATVTPAKLDKDGGKVTVTVDQTAGAEELKCKITVKAGGAEGTSAEFTIAADGGGGDDDDEEEVATYKIMLTPGTRETSGTETSINIHVTAADSTELTDVSAISGAEVHVWWMCDDEDGNDTADDPIAYKSEADNDEKWPVAMNTDAPPSAKGSVAIDFGVSKGCKVKATAAGNDDFKADETAEMDVDDIAG